MEQEEQDEYWKLMNTDVKNVNEINQRKISLIFCQLIYEDLDDTGKKALQLIKQLSLGKSYSKKYKSYIEKLQSHLSEDNLPNLYSPLIWALQENTAGYFHNIIQRFLLNA